MLTFILYVAGIVIGWFGHKAISKKDPMGSSNWERGFDAGLDFCKTRGYILARNDGMDEIMVEYEDTVSRYKRVVEHNVME